MKLTTQKQDLINWLNQLDDQDILKEIETIKSKQAFDFEKARSKGVSISEARKKSKAYIQTLPWQK